MEEAPKDTVLEELDKGVQQLQSGLCQLMVTAQVANLTPAPTQHCSLDVSRAAECRPNCCSCSQSCSFQFNSGVPTGGSDDSAETQPAHGWLNSEPVASSTPHQGLKGDINACPSGAEEEHQIFKADLSQEPGFKFNFTISEADADVDHTGQLRPEPTQSEEPEDFESSASKPLQKKKKSKTRKNKPPAGLPRDQKKLSHNSQGEEVNSTSLMQERCLSPEEQLQREVDWCIEQLELGLRSQKQADGALRAVRTLRSEKAPLVKKRQVMRSIFGDYRKKMEEERQRQFRLMLAATKSANIKAIGTQPRSQVFRKTTNKLSKVGVPPASDSMNPEKIPVDPGDQSYFQFNFF